MPMGKDYDDVRKPFVNNNNFFLKDINNNNNNAGSGSFYIVLCVLIVALGPIQFGFTVLNQCIIPFGLYTTMHMLLMINLFWIYLFFIMFIHIVWLFFTN